MLLMSCYLVLFVSSDLLPLNFANIGSLFGSTPFLLIVVSIPNQSLKFLDEAHLPPFEPTFLYCSMHLSANINAAEGTKAHKHYTHSTRCTAGKKWLGRINSILGSWWPHSWWRWTSYSWWRRSHSWSGHAYWSPSSRGSLIGGPMGGPIPGAGVGADPCPGGYWVGAAVLAVAAPVAAATMPLPCRVITCWDATPNLSGRAC